MEEVLCEAFVSWGDKQDAFTLEMWQDSLSNIV